MITLIVKDLNSKTYIGSVHKRFSTLLTYQLYSKDKNKAQIELEKIIHENDLIELDNNHQDNMICLNSYGLYLVDLPKKTILTNDDYGNIQTLTHSDIVSLVNPSYETYDKLIKIEQIKKVLESDYLILDEKTKEYYLMSLDEYKKNTNDYSVFMNLIENSNSKKEFKMNKKKLGWKITQSPLSEPKFYLKFFDHLMNQGIFLNQTENDELLKEIDDAIFSESEDFDKTQIEFNKIKELFSTNDAKKEKFLLENKIKQVSPKEYKVKL